MEELKKKAKMHSLKELIAEMHKMMLGGGGDEHMPVHEAIEESENELGLKGDKEGSVEEELNEPKSEMKKEEASGEEPKGFHEMVKSFMKKPGSIPVKGKSLVVAVKASKKSPPQAKKMKHG